MVTNTEVKELGHFINGKVVPGKSGKFSDVFNPSAGSVIARVPLATKQEVLLAIETAKKKHFQLGVHCLLANELKLS